MLGVDLAFKRVSWCLTHALGVCRGVLFTLRHLWPQAAPHNAPNAQHYKEWNLPRHDAISYIKEGDFAMYLIAIAWMYVVVMMALAEALSSQGTVLGAAFTLLLYGVLPLALVMYLLGTPMRRRAQRAAEAVQAQQSSGPQPDGSGHTPGDAVPPERKEA
jgi:hypothetical protein